METNKWHALHVRPRFERLVAFHLELQNLEYYLPLQQITRQSRDLVRSIELPLLPGYLFCSAQAGKIHSLRRIPGVMDVVAEGITDQIINKLKRIVETGLTASPSGVPPLGRTVTIQAGPLKGITGILQNIRDGAPKFIVPVDVIARSIHVAIDEQDAISGKAETAA